ncbi:MAG: hypothetical protein ACTHJX_15380 [Terriglobales bacterium]
MSRKKRRRYKLLQPEPESGLPQLSPRAQAIVIVIQWAFWFALAGILVAFLLILSLFTHWRVSEQVWLNLWPASLRLMSAANLSNTEMSHLALWLTIENGLLYCVFGLLLGGVHVGFRALRRRFS